MKSYWETAKFRIQLGTVSLVCAIIMTGGDMLSTYTANPTLVSTLYGTATVLIGAGLVKKEARNLNSSQG